MGKPDSGIKPGNGHGFFFRAKGILQSHPFFTITKRPVWSDAFLFHVGNTWLHVRQCDNDGYRITTCQLAGISLTWCRRQIAPLRVNQRTIFQPETSLRNLNQTGRKKSVIKLNLFHAPGEWGCQC